MDKNDEGNKAPTAFLVDLVSNRKIPIATPRCRVGRDDLNDIVISGDQSISRFHFIISFENGEFSVQDAKSRHGTFLNGNQLTVSESIKDGDVLKVGVSLFWFVVEGSQLADDPAKPSRVSAITESEVAAATAAQTNVGYKVGSDQLATSTSMPAIKALDQTQEMQKPDPAVMDKLEEAANSIKMDDKPEPKASLASLLADARAQEAQEPDKKKRGVGLAGLQR
jgi:pSer/pThr/pTyr-binding forkhead associated (FHA) protein